MKCENISKIDNGDVKCSLGDDGVHSYEDTCTVTCNPGYTLTGNGTRTCQSDGSWSGIVAVCRKGKNCYVYDCMIIQTKQWATQLSPILLKGGISIA